MILMRMCLGPAFAPQMHAELAADLRFRGRVGAPPSDSWPWGPSMCLLQWEREIFVFLQPCVG